MTQPTRLLILGHGEMGKAMQYLLQDRCELRIWVRHATLPLHTTDLESAVAEADIILFCLPVNPHQQITERIAPHLNQHTICISIAKGLDEAGNTAAQIFSQNLPTNNPYALLYGPMISEEIRAGRPAFAQLGYTNRSVFDRVHTLFKGTQLYIDASDDINGISWSVILKNVYAIIFGIADELKLGDNMRGFLAVKALEELEQIAIKMGGQQGSPYHLAGLGDLITTATSADSHHHELGCMLARGETENIKGEGTHTIDMVEKHQTFAIPDYPLFQLVQNIIRNPQAVAEKINAYVQRVYL